MRDQNNEEVTLSSFRGQKAVLVIFYPLAFTGICTGELCIVRDDLSTFQNDDVQIVTISVDSVYSHKIFSRARGLRVPAAGRLLAARRRRKAYGVFNETPASPTAARSSSTSDGIVRFAEMNNPGEGRDAQVWRDAIKPSCSPGDLGAIQRS